MAKVLNPFRFGNPVEGDFYLQRENLMRTVRNFTDNKIDIVLIGPRRFGKTSFVLQFLKEIEAPGKTGIFIDIFNITSHKDFLNQILRALKTKQNIARQIFEWAKNLSRLRPSLSYEHDLLSGNPIFSLSSDVSEKDIKDIIQDVLSSLGQLNDEVVVVIDEFQKIAEIEDSGWLEATLRTQMQLLKNVVFVFTGSRQSVIQDMLNNQARPFYRSCQPIEFPAFGDEFNEWIVGRFKEVGIDCEVETIRLLRKQVQNTPNYVQMVCFHLVSLGKEKISKFDMEDVLNTIVQQNSYAYQTLLATLTPIQQRALRLAAIEQGQVFSKELLDKYEISSTAALASAYRALKNKQILDEDTGKGKVIFDDPLFSIWLKNEFSPI